MRHFISRSTLVLAGIAGLTSAAYGQLSIPSDGSDGALVIATNTTIDLSQAVSTNWNANNTSHSGAGVYDASQWAVVFKYVSVTVSNGAKLTFINHPSHAPVVWLVSGDVTINGEISLDGQGAGYNAPQLAEPGPGGFRGGMGTYSSGVYRSSGFGPGGGGLAGDWWPGGAGGSFGSLGGWGSTTYGNPSLIPLVGGSGGGGYYNNSAGGGAGGGAILIASAGTLTVAGGVHSNGGGCVDNAAGGSGGGIRLVANTLAGGGYVQCLAGPGGRNAGGVGRVRIERVNNANSIQVTPDPSIVPLTAGTAPLIWLPATGPVATIVSIGGANSPADPRASFGTYGPDVTLPQTNTTQVIIATTNVESAATVTVRVSPRANGVYSETPAMVTQTNSLSPLVLLWTATNVPVNAGFSAVQVRVVRP